MIAKVLLHSSMYVADRMDSSDHTELMLSKFDGHHANGHPAKLLPDERMHGEVLALVYKMMLRWL